jgi:hypothetical protein
MIGSRAWGALMRRNLIYYRRHWLSSVRCVWRQLLPMNVSLLQCAALTHGLEMILRTDL